MRKLRESERSHQIRLAPRVEEKIHRDEHMMDLFKVECEEEVEASTMELDRLRDLAVKQQEVIEVLRQAVKEKERKLEQLSNKRRKEEFYKQWLELEPVAEVEDEDEEQQGEADSALSSAPSSLSPQPGRGAGSGAARETYDGMLLEIEELQTRLYEEQRELGHARSQVRDLEKALLQETRGSQTSRRALSEKLRDAEEREAGLIAELSELREQNELLEFRVLELEESPNPRDTPDPADSGIVSPEPIHLYKDHHSSKHRDRAVATVIPYTSSYNSPVLPSDPQKAPLSLQESGIFEGEDIEEDRTVVDNVYNREVELASQSTQTEVPAGELLQEVQRLQELRARIQERAAKVTPPSPVSDRKSETPFEFTFEVAPLRERIHELEAQLNAYESERQLSKQREEELLDENYRLTEKTYWLESELRGLQEKLNVVRLSSDATTMTEEVVEKCSQADASIQCENTESKDLSMSKCQKLYQTVIQNLECDERPKSEEETSFGGSPKDQPCLNCSELWKDCDARIRNLARTEFCLRQQISSLEHRESAFFETLRQADATWAKLEADYEAKQKEMSNRLSAQIELNRALFEHLTKLSETSETSGAPKALPEEPMEVDDCVRHTDKSNLTIATQTDAAEECRCRNSKSVSRSSSSATEIVVRADSSKVSTISRTSIKMTAAECDEIDTSVPPIPLSEPPTELATEAKEEVAAVQAREFEIARQRQTFEQQQQPETLVSVDQSSSDKKVSSPTKGAKSLNTWNARRRAISFERNLFTRSHRLTLYQEICV